jgi:predicted NACHT family NTPase
MTGIETAFITTVAGQLTKFGWDVISKNEFLNQEIHVGKLTQDALYHLYQQYAKNYHERHGQVSVLRMSKAMDLESIYVNVQCLNDFARDYLIDSVTLEKRFRETNQRQFRYDFDKDKRKDGLTFANEFQYLMVFGGPGIGKSTFLRKVGLEALKGKQGNYQHRLIPVFLELKKFKESEINIQTLIEKEFEICGFPDVQKNVSKNLLKVSY